MPKTILVIDDEPVVLQVVSLCLRRDGYSVYEAKTPEESLAIAETPGVSIDLILADNSISETRSHPSLVSDILEWHPDAQILRCSGQPEGWLRSSGQLRPTGFFLQKPFMPRDLTAKVESIIGVSDRSTRPLIE